MDPRIVKDSQVKMTLTEFTEQIKAKELLFSLIYKKDFINLQRLIKDVHPAPDLNIKNDSGNTPLIEATRHSFSMGVCLLIQAKANIETKDKSGHSPLFWATRNGDEQAVRFLLDAKADISTIKTYHNSALILAARKGFATCVKILVEAKANIDNSLIDVVHTSTLFFMVESSSTAIKTLIEAKANIEAKDSEGRTALGIAACKGDAVSVRTLIEAKANVLGQDKQGHTPLQIARINKHSICVKLLKPRMPEKTSWFRNLFKSKGITPHTPENNLILHEKKPTQQ